MLTWKETFEYAGTSTTRPPSSAGFFKDLDTCRRRLGSRMKRLPCALRLRCLLLQLNCRYNPTLLVNHSLATTLAVMSILAQRLRALLSTTMHMHNMTALLAPVITQEIRTLADKTTTITR